MGNKDSILIDAEIKNIIDYLKSDESANSFTEAQLTLIAQVYMRFIVNEGTDFDVAIALLNTKKEKGGSIKIGNIIFDFKKALQDAIQLAITANSIDLEKISFKDVCLILHMLGKIMDVLTIKFTEDECKVLYLIYLHEGNGRGITYKEMLAAIEKQQIKLSKEMVEKALKNLEDIKAVSLIDGKYHIVENIIVDWKI